MVHLESRKSYSRKRSVLSDLKRADASTASNKALSPSPFKKKKKYGHLGQFN